jgi:glyceraldehyde 3-phosphate dehydrogenase
LLLNHPTIEVVAKMHTADTKTMAHLLKYDSIHGVLPNKQKGMEEDHFLFFMRNKFQI